jgi:hypothetical protein
VPVRKGAEIQIVSVKTIPVTNVAKLRILSLNQSDCGCSGKNEGEGSMARSCNIGSCTTIMGENYDCWETWEGQRYCSGCCLDCRPLKNLSVPARVNVLHRGSQGQACQP